MSRATLGIVMQRYPDGASPFGAGTRFAEKITGLGQCVGVGVVALGPDDLDPEVGVRDLGSFDPREGWNFAPGPLPDVAWDRCFRCDHAALLKRVECLGIRPLNRGRLSKWEVHQVLQSSPDLARHLPRTVSLTEARTVTDMLCEFPAVYIKPIWGSVGRGIIRALPGGLGQMRLQYVSRHTGRLREVYAGPGQIDRWLKRSGAAGQYIVQQGLDLGIYGGRPADVRVLVQRDGTGRWSVTGLGARVAASGRFTANLHTGGTAVPVEQVLQALAPLDARWRKGTQEELHRLALTAAGEIDGAAGPLGELGLDFGVDQDGAVWFIEQNVQPGRAIFGRLGRWDLWELAHLRPLHYACYLAAKKVDRALLGAAT